MDTSPNNYVIFVITSLLELMRYLLLLLTWTIPLFLTAQQYPLRVLDFDDGLTKAAFYEVAKDRQGYMWLASDAALVRYDGSEFKYYTVRDGFSGNFVMDIDFDFDNNMWISTYGGGIARFDGKLFHAYNTNNGFPSNYVRSITISTSGDMWVASEDIGVIRIEKGKKPVVLNDAMGKPFFNPWCLFEDSKGDIWVAAIGGIGKFNKQKNFKYELMYSVNYTFTSLTEDKDGFIWGGGAYYLVKAKGDSVVDCSNLLPPGTIIFDMHVGREDGKLYIATADRLIVLDKDSTYYLDKTNGIKNSQFWDVYEDEVNDIWLSSGGGGIVKYDTRGISLYDHQNDLVFGSMILDIVEDNTGKLIFGTELNGYFFYENGKFGRFDQPGIKDIVTAYATVHNKTYNRTLFTSATGNIFWMKDNKVIHSYQPEKKDVKLIYDIEFIDSNRVMLLSDQGCYMVNPEKNYPDPIEGIPPGFYRTVFTDAENFHWILGDKGEVFKWKNGKAEDLKEKINPERYNLLEGCYDAYHHLYWFASNAGLIVWDGTNRLVLHSKNGLNADMPGSISQDNEHRIWIGHDRGLTCIDLERKVFKYIGYDEGFTSVGVNLRSLLFTASSGQLWVGSVSNMYKIDLEKLAPKNKRTKLRLQEVSFRDKIYFNENYFTDSLPDIYLNYNENNLQIDLAALDFMNASKVRYSWMLKNYDHDFMPYVYFSEVNYTNLAPGDYEFIAKAIDSDGFETNTVSIFIHIEKPFWEKIWFYILEIAIFGAIVFLSFIFSSRSSNNRFGQIMTFLTIIILFESAIFYLSVFINPLTNGIPVFQLVMNIILAAILQPMEQFVKRLMNKAVTKNQEER